MGRLTPEERRRVFLIRQRANDEMLARLSAPIALADPRFASHRRGQILATLMIVALLSGAWFAVHTVEFHLPASVVEALLPWR